MQTQNDSIKKDINDVFKKILRVGTFTSEQKKQLFSKLEEAITLRSIEQLLALISSENKAVVEKMEFESQEEFLLFLGKMVDPQILTENISLATTKVLGAFFDSMIQTPLK